MWRVVAAVLVLGFVAYKFVGRNPGGVPGSVAGKPVYEGYLETRMLMKIEQREIELVAIEEHPFAEDCDRQAMGNRVPVLCPAAKNVSCTLKTLECSGQVEPRYQKMLQGQPVSTHYARIEVADRGATPRRAVVLGWGMTEDESLILCNAIRAGAGEKISGSTVTCI